MKRKTTLNEEVSTTRGATTWDIICTTTLFCILLFAIFGYSMAFKMGYSALLLYDIEAPLTHGAGMMMFLLLIVAGIIITLFHWFREYLEDLLELVIGDKHE